MRILTCTLTIILFLNFYTSVFAQSLSRWQAAKTNHIELILNTFYRNKAKAVIKNAKTYRERYNAISFCSYPRTFWGDSIPSVPQFATKGRLFTESLKDTYAMLKEQSADSGKNKRGTVAQTIKKIVLNPRRINVAKTSPMPSAGDVWHSAFYMASYYAQLGDYADKIRQEKAIYQEYLNYRKQNNRHMLAGYENYDFALAKYNPSVFEDRQTELANFIKAYTAQSNIFIRKVLVPLQTDKVEGADVRGYLAAHINKADLPRGISAKILIDALTEQIGPADVFYKQAEKVNPSFYTQLISTYKILTPSAATWDDVSNSLSMFEYIAPSTLMERLVYYRTIPSRKQVLDELAGSFAAEALNKSLAQTASDLFEFEKPFYYSFDTINNAQEDIAANWYAIAVNKHFGDKMIAKIAADNILRSGIRAKQDVKLSASIQARVIQENLEFYKKAIPFAVDFTAGDTLFKAVTPLFYNVRVKNLAQTLEREVRSSENILKNVKDGAASVFNVNEAASVHIYKINATSVHHVQSYGNFQRAVWKIRNSEGEVTHYIKYGRKTEIDRTRQLDNIITKNNFAEKYPLIEIEYPRIIKEDLKSMPEHLRKKVEEEFNSIHDNVRNANHRAQQPFITNKVDVSGFTVYDLSTKYLPVKMISKKSLNDVPITAEEWSQIVRFYSELNAKGFEHTDVANNLHIRRLENGKLKLTLLDFELEGFSDAGSLRWLGRKLVDDGLMEPPSAY